MVDVPDSFSITTPIYYATAAPSIGSAYTTVAADMAARWHRQRGESVWFLTGTDEHGEKVLRAAEAHGVTPQQWADKVVAEEWLPVLSVIDASNDDFIRTTEERHTRRVQEFWQRLYDKGLVYKGVYQGPYCVDCEEFKLAGRPDRGGRRHAAVRDPRPSGRGALGEQLLLQALGVRRPAARPVRAAARLRRSRDRRATR